MPKFTDSFGPASSMEIEGLEQRLGIKLPDDYKQFILKTNGGVPAPNGFVVPERGQALVDILYGIRTERIGGDLEFEQEQAALWEPLPEGFVAIAHDPGGSSILLATIGKHAGKVFYWDRNGLWVRDDRSNTFLIAQNFSDFIELLCEL